MLRPTRSVVNGHSEKTCWFSSAPNSLVFSVKQYFKKKHFRHATVAIIVAIAASQILIMCQLKGSPIKGQNRNMELGRKDRGCPVDFDWQSYLIYNDDLRSSGIRTPQAAWNHYQTKGKHRYVKNQHISVLLRYAACHGLFNQMYAHMAALILGNYLNADIMMPPSLYRNSYSSRYSVLADKASDLSWTSAPQEALLDVQNIRASIKVLRGRSLYEYSVAGTQPNCSMPELAYMVDLPEGISEQQVVRLEDLYIRGADIHHLWDRAADAILKKYFSLAAEGFPKSTIIVLDLPSTFFSIMTVSCMEEAREAAKMLTFSPQLKKLADLIVSKIWESGVKSYNGIHFRVERDAADWQRLHGGADAYVQLYLKACKRAGFSSSQSLYVASGLLSYADLEEVSWLNATLSPLAKTILYKEMFLTQNELAQYNTEQLALLDFLVLAQCQTFVGIGTSTFSVYLREYRRLHGRKDRSSNVFVSSKLVGTDTLFQRCSHFSD
ncbi:hypothetical protein CEUSTIGMA_g1429.t1 [Chlamydomonas eustigma]|uniref:O-fucosyltransferase family protein n=1 Tax=Chlamydomonas eustigma TaxID=1157962 RepID=A0A250WTC3_9CHLO|nr:hypothetical protein CEUSTIGMA_g1429.t1 [Chlamydomonas eustigma]|eukprot:GAX73979.1 hypothetical protein CEUSTIGMA_g1429.t1 [Chlamydomonas eustigma]